MPTRFRSILALPLLALTWSGSTTTAHAQLPTTTSRFLWADANRDGQRDALVLRRDGSARLIVELAEGGFVDRTDSLGLADIGPVRAAAWGDADGDGRLELAVAGDSVRLFAQAAGGAFVDRSLEAGLPARDDVVAVEWLDFDEDGAQDLLLHGVGEEILLSGAGDGSFREVELGLAPLEVPVAVSAPESPEPTTASTEESLRPEFDSGRGPGRSGAGGPPAHPAHPAHPAASRSRGGAARPAPPGSRGGASGSPGAPGGAQFSCLPSILDLSAGGCLTAASFPTLGSLYPLSQELFVDGATGFVGVGTLSPTVNLHVEGELLAGAGHSLDGVASTIPGGEKNVVSSPHSGVLSGLENSVVGSPTLDWAGYSTVVGGRSNAIRGDHSWTFGLCSTIGGGYGNTIENGEESFVGGGRSNRIGQLGGSDVRWATIAGGFGGAVDADYGAIGGGALNRVGGLYGAVPGGSGNVADGRNSLAAGHYASALHDGSFVWSDRSTTAAFASTGEDQFLIDAEGGVGIGTNAPEADLHVRGASPLGSLYVTPGVSDSHAELVLFENQSATLGAILRYNGTKNDLEIRGKNFSGETDVHFFVDRDSGVAGLPTSAARLGIGTASPSGKLHVVDGAGGNGSVVLPGNSISDSETLNEAGVAYDRAGGGTMNGTTKSIAGRTLNAPTDGYVIALGTTEIKNSNAFVSEDAFLKIRLSQTGEDTVNSKHTVAPAVNTTMCVQGVFAVSAGANTFFLDGVTGGLDLSAIQPRLSLMFVPTPYGVVDEEN